MGEPRNPKRIYFPKPTLLISSVYLSGYIPTVSYALRPFILVYFPYYLLLLVSQGDGPETENLLLS